MPFINVKEQTPLSQKDQIIKLMSEVKCTLAPSTIHGIGVFAIRDIRKGERCYCTPNSKKEWYSVSYSNLNKLWPEQKELILQRWASIINGSLFTSPNDDVTLILFMNHSENPNYDIYTDSALKDIKKDEELVEDYRVMKNWEKVFPWLKADK